MMQKFFAISFASMLGLLAGCAGSPSSSSGTSASGGSTGGSGITVFGTIDAGVTGTKGR